MKNKDIKVQAFPLNRVITNNQKVYYSKAKNVRDVTDNPVNKNISNQLDEKEFKDMDIKEKLNYLTHLPVFMNDVVCSIETKSEVINQIIESANNEYAVLKDGQKIKIEDIENIILM